MDEVDCWDLSDGEDGDEFLAWIELGSDWRSSDD
jgi:hypothetical protein